MYTYLLKYLPSVLDLLGLQVLLDRVGLAGGELKGVEAIFSGRSVRTVKHLLHSHNRHSLQEYVGGKCTKTLAIFQSY